MSGDGGPGDDAWPVDLAGIIESIVTTRQSPDRWNAAALGIAAGSPVTATTWGRTRTRRNFARHGFGYVQFTRDPVDFVEAALTISEHDEPILGSSDAWVKVDVDPIDEGRVGGTECVTWRLEPVDRAVVRRAVPTTNRGYYAAIEASVAASRLDVDPYDETRLLERLAECERIVRKCGGRRDREAFDRISTITGWKSRNESL